MPDFERLLRDAQLYASDESKKEKLKCYFKGQDEARKEVVFCFCVFAFLYVVYGVLNAWLG